jgi:hypothetical protein
MSRNSMLAVAELYTRADAIDAAIVEVDHRLKILVEERQRLTREFENITAGINAIGQACGLFANKEIQS